MREGVLRWVSFVYQRSCTRIAVRIVALGVPTWVTASPAVTGGMAVYATALAKESAATGGVLAAESGAVNVPIGASGIESGVRGGDNRWLNIVN